MHFPLASVTLMCVIGFAASQSFSFSFGLDDATSGINETPFSFQKLKSPSPSASKLIYNDRSTARGASRMASGSSRGRIQDSPQIAVTSRPFTTSASVTRIATRDLFTPKVTTPAPVFTRKPTSHSIRKSIPTTTDKKHKIRDQPITSFSFSRLPKETEIERVAQSISRNTSRIPQPEVRNTARIPQSSFVEKANLGVNNNKERIPQRSQTNNERIPQKSASPIPERVPTSSAIKSSRAPQSINNITKPILQSVIQPILQSVIQPILQSVIQPNPQSVIQPIPQSVIRTVERIPQNVMMNQPESPKVNEIEIGRSPCARGIQGHDCRMHLLQTALACTSGPCHQCQQCGSITPDQWVSCCRDHFLCCRSLARSCQKCDHPTLTPFCKVSFGKCK